MITNYATTPPVFQALLNMTMLVLLRARETITSHFRIPPSGQLGPIFTRTILGVGLATPAVALHQSDPTCPKSGREFWEGIVPRTLNDDVSVRSPVQV